MCSLRPFRVHVPEADLEDLRERLRRTRWPEAETVDDWSQGVPLAYLQEICEYWAAQYDWRHIEARLNELDQLIATIDDQDIHVLHARSPVETARPLVITHGWPGSVLEFLDVIGPLSDPEAHGGDPADAFHVVCPALPGFGFSGKPTSPGWGLERDADAWVTLMEALGYERFLAQGGDWGAGLTMVLARKHPDRLDGIHLNMPLADPSALLALGEPTAEEHKQLARLQHYVDTESGYAAQQRTRPQTTGYALTDSPAGQCAWILEKFKFWADCDGSPEDAIDRDRLLDNVTLYWLTASAASSARIYWESFNALLTDTAQIDVPTGHTQFPEEIFHFSERWLRTRFADLRHYSCVDRGGHFAAIEEPDLFVAEVRAACRKMPSRA